MTDTTFDLDTLYLDLDGVLADFDRGVKAVTGRWPHEQDARSMWPAAAKHDDFFGSLEMMEDGPDLWAFCAALDPVILTGLPRGQWAEPQKRRWVATHLGDEIEVITCMSKDKPRWSDTGNILVDDRERYRTPWEERGGTFIHHTSAAETIAALKQLGLHPAA